MKVQRTKEVIEFNNYQFRLHMKLVEMKNLVTKYELIEHDGEQFLIICEKENELENPNGSMKWEGWEIVGQLYRVAVYKEGTYKFKNEEAILNDLPIYHHCGNNKDEANQKYVEFKKAILHN